MSALTVTVAIDLSSLRGLHEDLDKQLQHKVEGPVTKAFKQWGVVYRSWIKERFDIYSKGRGDWPPLAKSTRLARRGPAGKRKSKISPRKKAGKIRTRVAKLNAKLAKAKTAKRYRELRDQIKKAKSGLKKNTNLKDRKFTILRDTGTLFAALSPTFEGLPGAIEETIPYGINVGYGGNTVHPSTTKATIAEIANYHQIGAGHLPVRRIIVSPPETVTQRMSELMQKAISDLILSWL